jgi:hypothetical protein
VFGAGVAGGALLVLVVAVVVLGVVVMTFQVPTSLIPWPLVSPDCWSPVNVYSGVLL